MITIYQEYLVRAYLAYDQNSESLDGGWSAWSEFTPCFGNCGYGSRIRARQCSAPAPKNGGSPCFGKAFESEDCDADPKFCYPFLHKSLLVEADVPDTL